MSFYPLMARPKKQPIIDDDNDDGGDESAPASSQDLSNALDEQSAAELAGILAAEGLAQGTVRVLRKGPLGSGFQYVATLSVEDMRNGGGLELIADTYGGGDYKLQFRDASQQWFRGVSLSIDPRRKGKLDAKEHPIGGDGNGAALLQAIQKLSPPESPSVMLVKMMEMQQAASQQFMLAMQQSNATMLQAITGMVAALKPAPAPVAAPTDKGFDVLTALKVFDSIKGKESNPMGEIVKVLEFAKRLYEERNEGDSNGWLEQVVRGLAPLFMRGAMGGAGAPAGGEPWQPPGLPPAPVAAGATGPQQTTETPAAGRTVGAPGATMETSGAAGPAGPIIEQQPIEQPMTPELQIKKMAQQVFPMLAMKASTGADPEDAAELIVNPLVLSDEQFEALIKILKADNWRTELFGIMAPAAAGAWFEKLRAAILERDEKEE